MQVRTKSVDSFQAHKPAAAHNWAIGWTPAEASAAAQRRTSAEPQKKGGIGMRSVAIKAS
jgi:hypothetical protein